MSTKSLQNATAAWRDKHPLSRMPRLGAGAASWIMGTNSPSVDQRPQLNDVNAEQPRYNVDPSPLQAVDLGSLDAGM